MTANPWPRIFAAAALGALVLLGCSYLSWLFAPWRQGAIESIEADSELIKSLGHYLPKEAVYQFPGADKINAESRMERLGWLAEAREGPFGYVFMQPEGADPMAPGVPIRAFALNFFSLLPVIWLLRRAGPGLGTFHARWAAVAGIGLVCALATHGQQWNWLFFPTPFVVAQMLDTLLRWTILGVVLALVCRPAS